MKICRYCHLLLICLFGSSVAKTQQVLPVRNLHFDESSVRLIWEAPRSTVLNQDFEGTVFPPQGWIGQSQNSSGWMTGIQGGSQYFPVPEHTHYAYSNDDTLGATGNSCCDYLITPSVNLSDYPGYRLVFDSYYNGYNGQKASLEMSTDNGTTWSLLQSLAYFPGWKKYEIDLSAYSGAGGLSGVRFAFHADDQGFQASGWAIDNVSIFSDSTGVNGYSISADQIHVGDTTALAYPLSPDLFNCGEQVNVCVSALYPSSLSADTCIAVITDFAFSPVPLPPSASDTAILFTWLPAPGNQQCVGYHIYISDTLAALLPATQTSFLLSCLSGEVCIDITSLYDLTICGFPGAIAESIKKTVCGYVNTGFNLPFQDDFSSGTFQNTAWTAGSNWSITTQDGNNPPAAKFSGGKSGSAYTSELISWNFKSLGFTECTLGTGAEFSFDLKLEDVAAGKTEKLIVEVISDNKTRILAVYENAGSFSWRPLQINLTPYILDNDFRIVFKAEGESWQNMAAWYIDNIRIQEFINFLPPMAADAQRIGDPENDILISWEPADPNHPVFDYILDDGSAEQRFTLNTPGEFRAGNFYPVTESGVLKRADVYFQGNTANAGLFSVEVYDSARNLVGTSLPFVPAGNAFTRVVLPDLPFSGSFYGMIHGSTAGMDAGPGMDTDGPNAMPGTGWIFDGSVWNSLTELGYPNSAFMIRFQAAAGDTSIEPRGACGVLGYNIYRNAYMQNPAGPNGSGSPGWSWIGATPYGINCFVDRNLENAAFNCYEYKVTEVYADGESSGSQTAWDCIFVGLKESPGIEIRMFPNPSSTQVTLKFPESIQQISVFTVAGIKVGESRAVSSGELTLSTASCRPGIYLVRFLSRDGGMVTRQLVVTR
jgi:hypothetical protein